MNLRKQLTAIAIFSLSFLTVAFATVDCYAELTLNVNSAIGQYYTDVSECPEDSDTYDICVIDAGMTMINNIDNAGVIHNKCCCDNQQPCCDR